MKYHHNRRLDILKGCRMNTWLLFLYKLNEFLMMLISSLEVINKQCSCIRLQNLAMILADFINSELSKLLWCGLVLVVAFCYMWHILSSTINVVVSLWNLAWRHIQGRKIQTLSFLLVFFSNLRLHCVKWK